MGKRLTARILMVGCFLIVAGHAMANPLFRDNPDRSRTLLGHVPAQEIAQSSNIGPMNSTQTLDLRFLLPLKNEAQLDAFLQSLNDPKSPNYHNYLTPDQFKILYGASDIDLKPVQDYLNAHSLIVTGKSANGLVLTVSASVGTVNKVFGTKISNFQRNADGSRFFATEIDPSIPAELVGKINAIAGLDNALKPTPNFHIASNTAVSNNAAQTISKTQMSALGGVVVQPKLVSGPISVPNAFAYYDMNRIPTSTKNEQSVTLIEFDGFLASDISKFESSNGLNVPTQIVSVDGYNQGVSNSNNTLEVTLDIEQIASFAPSTSKIIVYEAPWSYNGWVDELGRIVSDVDSNGHLVNTVISLSWGGVESQFGSYIAKDSVYFKQMAADGQTVVAAAGDGGAGQLTEPAASPYVTGVGITYPDSNGVENASSYSSGGRSINYLIPTYQQASITKASLGSTTMRNVPDVSTFGDPYKSYYTFYIQGQYINLGGSSVGAPVWAAFISRVNQARVNAGLPLVGCVNPMLYQIAQSGNYGLDFNDIKSGVNGFPAVAGYDLASGLGSFDGYNLFNDLVGYNSTLPVAPAGLSASLTKGAVQLSWTAVSGSSIKYNVYSSTSSTGSFQKLAAGTGVSATNFTDTSVLANNLYYYSVSAVNSKGEGYNSSTIGGFMPFAPATPTGLLAVAGNAQVSLSWNASVGATSYTIKKSWVVNGVSNSTNILTTYNTYLDTNLLNGTTYSYTVSAGDVIGNTIGISAASSVVSAKPMLPVPSAPSGLTAVIGKDPANGKTMVTFSWGASANATSYNVEKAVSLGTLATIGSTSGTSYKDESTFLSNTTYYYTISAVNSSGASPIVNYVYVSFAPAASTLATPVAGINSVSLSWNAMSGVSTTVERAFTPTGTYAQIASGITSGSFTDLTALYPNKYYYVVINNNLGGPSPASNQVSAVALAAPIPSAPTGLTVQAGNASVKLSWSAVFGAAGYNVLMASSYGGVYQKVSSQQTPTNFTMTGLQNGSPYYFAVQTLVAVNSVMYAGPASAAVSATPVSPAVPAIPTGLTTIPGYNQVALSWNAVSGATSYHVKRYDIVNGLGSFGPIVTVTSNNYIDTTVKAPNTYFYYVSALNSAGEGQDSIWIIAQMPVLATPPAPFITGIVSGVNQMTISWTSVQTATSYNVKRSEYCTNTYTTIATGVKTNSYLDTSGLGGVETCYVVSAVNAAGESPNSIGFASASTQSATIPSGLMAVSSKGSVVLTWGKMSNVAYYNVYRSQTNGGSYSFYTSVINPYLTDSGLTSGKTYYYVVTAMNYINNQVKESGFSNQAIGNP